MAARTSVALLCALVLHLCAVAYGGFASEAHSGAACCIRTFVRSTGDPKHLRDTELNILTVGDPKGPKFTTDDLIDDRETVISSGVVRPVDTLCVDADSDMFKNYYDYYSDLFGASRKRSEDSENRSLRCPVWNRAAPYGFYEIEVQDEYECAIHQSCNNYEYDYSPCFEPCLYACSNSPTSVDEECFPECRVTCEYECVGRCFNDPECIVDCVFDVVSPRRRGNVLNIFYSGYPTILKDMVYGLSGQQIRDRNDFPLEDVGDLTFAPNRRDVGSERSASRPYYNVRGGEYEFSMSLYPGARCSQMKNFCRSPKSIGERSSELYD